MPSRPFGLLLAGLIFIHAFLVLEAARVETPTVDEYAHVPAGLAYWKSGDFALYSKNPPLIKMFLTIPLALAPSDIVSTPERTGEALGWGPWVYGYQFEVQNQSRYFDLFFWARSLNLLFSIVTGLLIFVWARKSFGDLPAVLAAAGFWFSPTVLAHAHLATVDMGATALIFLFCFWLREGLRHWWQLGVSLGLAMAAKFTAIFLLPFFLFACGLDRSARPKKGSLLRAGGVLLLALAVLPLVYGFDFDWPRVSELTPQTLAMQKLFSWFPEGLRLPLPLPFLVGFDAQAFDAQAGEFGSYFFGEWSQHGHWYAGLAAFFLKEQLLTLLLILLSPFALRSLRRPRAEVLSLVLPILFIGVPLMFFNSLQIGIRYLLPLFPFLFILIAAPLQLTLKGKRLLSLVILLGWMIPMLLIRPEFLSHFNGVAKIWGPPEEMLLDSNLDWGQDLYRLKTVASVAIEQRTPIYVLYFGHVSPRNYGIDYQLVPDHPVEGLVAVSVNFRKGYPYVAPAPDGSWTEVKPTHLDWLRGFQPIARVGSLLIFDTRK